VLKMPTLTLRSSRGESIIAGTALAIERLTVSTPPGSVGAADFTVATSQGSTTVSGGFTYLASSQTYPIAGALDAIVYDQARQQLYIANEDHNRVEIFDLRTRSYKTAIFVGNQPTSIALTPDGARLAVVNFGDGSISVIDPNIAQVIATYSALTSADIANGGRTRSIAPAAPHRVLLNLAFGNTLGGANFHLVNLDTGSLSCAGVAGCSSNGTDMAFSCCGLSVMASVPDGTKIFLADSYANGRVGMMDLRANTVADGYSGTFNDIAASSDGTLFSAGLGISNSQLSRVGIMGYEPYGSDIRNHVASGEKLNASGSLLFVPQNSGVQVFDVHTGRAVQNIVLSDGIPRDMNTMALDETGTKMFLISNTGITIAQLAQAPLSIATVGPSKGTPGTQIQVRGSGFQSGASASLGTFPATTVYLDSQSLLVTVPAMPVGPASITVTNPNGGSYSFDAAFDVQ
jgi:YVTN family beta-propeller protein